jgi:hypothetical protein
MCHNVKPSLVSMPAPRGVSLIRGENEMERPIRGQAGDFGTAGYWCARPRAAAPADGETAITAAPLRVEIDACGCVWRNYSEEFELAPCAEHWLLDAIDAGYLAPPATE